MKKAPAVKPGPRFVAVQGGDGQATIEVKNTPHSEATSFWS